MQVKIKKLVKEAVIPTYAHIGDAGMDLTAVTKKKDEHGNICYGTGLAFEVPAGYFMMLVPRSSNCKKDLLLTNHAGIVDSTYRGEIFFKYGVYREHTEEVFPGYGLPSTTDTSTEVYNIGERIGQLIILPYPHIEFLEVEELSETERGVGGYGSTGN